MTARPLRLDDFSAPQGASGGSEPSAAPVEERLDVYEKGYKAGWDDAAAAAAEDQARITSDFAKTLQEMSFSYHEARAHVLSTLGPLLTLMAEKVLPEAAHQGLAQTLAQAAAAAADTAAGQPVELVVSPANRAALDRLLEDRDPGFPLTVVEEPSLGPGQAFLRAGNGETAIDLDDTLTAIREAVAGFLHIDPPKETRAHA